MLGTVPLLGTELGYDSVAPVDAEYIITGYINQDGKTLPAGTKLPMDSLLRRDSNLLLTEIRVGRLKLVAAKAATSKVTQGAVVPPVTKPKSKKR